MNTPVKGTLVAGRYRLQALIGEGGMARVWRAYDETLARSVAVKFLFVREDRDGQTTIDRFLREARIAAAVRHPNVVDILDFGTSEGRPYMVMELLEGESLEDRLQREPAMTLEELLRAIAGALDGLAAVHRAGIVHRDLKPSNLFLLQTDDDSPPRPKLLDFGVSRDTDPGSGRRSALTTTDGYLVGTPEYMSPEQARGLSDIDWRTDLYSVGVILYEGLTGRLPFNAQAVGDLIIEIVGGGAPTVFEVREELGEALSNVVAQAMRIKREERFQSAREMKDALLEAVDVSLGRGIRPSLPMPAPERHLGASPSGSRRPPISSVSTLDGSALPWGAEAVPTFGAEPKRGSLETPHSWTLETKLPGGSSPPAKRWPWALAGVAALAPLAVGAWIVLTPAPDPNTSAATPPPVERAVDQALERAVDQAVERAVEPTTEPAAAPPVALPAPPPEVSIHLEGLPDDAEVRVDGALARAPEGILRITQDNAQHRISVSAPGRRAFELLHRASEDGTYEVELPPIGGGRRPVRGPRGESEGTGASEAAPSPPPGPSGPHDGVFREYD